MLKFGGKRTVCSPTIAGMQPGDNLRQLRRSQRCPLAQRSANDAGSRNTLVCLPELRYDGMEGRADRLATAPDKTVSSLQGRGMGRGQETLRQVLFGARYLPFPKCVSSPVPGQGFPYANSIKDGEDTVQGCTTKSNRVPVLATMHRFWQRSAGVGWLRS